MATKKRRKKENLNSEDGKRRRILTALLRNRIAMPVLRNRIAMEGLEGRPVLRNQVAMEGRHRTQRAQRNEREQRAGK